uniref:Expansin-like EG45 domain-containing protein n=2 Tax=Kalmanozyma brasiliensis (strain GHG001) TaxID=1365824 RepID=V5E729_KALBG
MHKKKVKGQCAVDPKGQESYGQPPQSGGSKNADAPPATGTDAPSRGSGGQVSPGNGSQKGNAPPGDSSSGSGAGTKPEGYTGGSQPGTSSGSASGDKPSTDDNSPTGYSSPSAGSGTKPDGYASGPQPGASSGSAFDHGSYGKAPRQGQGSAGPAPVGYSPSSGKYKGAQGTGLLCKGVRSTTVLTPTSSVQPSWFSPDLIHHGPGTQFGGPGLWQGGACMLDSLPHTNLPSIAMDQSFFQDGLACGTCVEIGPTSASQFSNSAVWTVEKPRRGTLPAGKKTVAIVSDLCPGVNQCFSGLDMHLDAWNSVTSNADGSKLPVNWRFVNCKDAFEGSGIEKLQVHWREGCNPGFFQVQIRGSHEAVVKVEMRWSGQGWKEASHVDASWWKWDLGGAAGFDQAKTGVMFRITDWQGQTIASEISTLMGTDLFFDANFDSVASDQY